MCMWVSPGLGCGSPQRQPDSVPVSIPAQQGYPIFAALAQRFPDFLGIPPTFQKNKNTQLLPSRLTTVSPTHTHPSSPSSSQQPKEVIFPIPLWALLDSLLFVWESHLALCRAYSWFCTRLIPAKLKGPYRAQGKHLLYSPCPKGSLDSPAENV